MGENVPVNNPEDIIFVVDTAKALIFFTYDPVRNVFHGNGDKIQPGLMRQLHEWIGERLL
jgi:hypothetical protein